jgi:hypothetical protein
VRVPPMSIPTTGPSLSIRPSESTGDPCEKTYSARAWSPGARKAGMAHLTGALPSPNRRPSCPLPAGS